MGSSAGWMPRMQAAVFKVSGRDARRYLHNRLSQDIRAVPVGAAVRAAALTPQGRVEGLFSLFVATEEIFLLVCDGGQRNTILAALSRYIVAERISCEDVSHAATWLHRAGPRCADEDAVRLGVVHAVSSARISPSGWDYLCLGETPDLVCARAEGLWGPPLSPAQFDLLRWYQGYAEYPSEISLECILSEAGQRDAVSFTKGCYVGQEVMERSDAIGKVPRTLVRVRLKGIFAQDGGAGATVAALKGKGILNTAGVVLGKVMAAVVDPERGITGVFAFLRTGAFGAAEPVVCEGLAGEVVV